MPKGKDTGSRIRNRRLNLGMRQADLAADVGISASYLNLIEHNRRRVGAQLLRNLCARLQVDPALMSDGAAEHLLTPMQRAAAGFPEAEAELGQMEEVIARMPGWAAIIAAQQARIGMLEAQAEALRNRLAHDTQLATSLHEVISTATAIRSTASILTETPDLDPEWQARFHKNIDGEAERLALSSQMVLSLLDEETSAPDGTSPRDQADAALARRGYVLEEDDPFDDVTTIQAREILQEWSGRMAEDAKRLPESQFVAAARAVAYDPARLAAQFNAPLDQILRRLAALHGGDHPPMGLAIFEAAAGLIYQKPVLDFRLRKSGSGQEIWPIYRALSQVGHPMREVVQPSGAMRTPYECFAIALPVGPVLFDRPPVIRATMLVRPASAGL